jgi:DNA processing protein
LDKTTPNQLLYNIALTMLPKVGSILAKNLLAYCGSAEAVFKAGKSKLLKIPHIGEDRVDAILKSDALVKAEEEIKFIEKHSIRPIFFTEQDYPERLKDCADSPLLLFYKGNADLNASKKIAVVGTRKATEYGKEVTKKLIEDFSATGALVVSGLAYGIDIAAHNAALDRGLNTIGVLAHGLNKIYPDAHRNSAKRMLAQGGLLTEYGSTSIFHPANFPMRNRIVAGMCDLTVVVESDIKGGAVITANIANSYNRDVFAVPGRSVDRYSSGCNFLIKTYKATMVENGRDILEAMNWGTEINAKARKPKQLTLKLSENEGIVYNILKEGESVIDVMLGKSGLPSGELSSTLLEMEMNDLIVSLPGKRYKLL